MSSLSCQFYAYESAVAWISEHLLESDLVFVTTKYTLVNGITVRQCNSAGSAITIPTLSLFTLTRHEDEQNLTQALPQVLPPKPFVLSASFPDLVERAQLW